MAMFQNMKCMQCIAESGDGGLLITNLSCTSDLRGLIPAFTLHMWCLHVLPVLQVFPSATPVCSPKGWHSKIVHSG